MNRRRRRNCRGTTAVEAAVVLPIFFVFLFGLLEIGHAFMVNNMLKAACRNAARHGVAEGVTSDEVEAKVREYLAATLDTQHVTVIVKDASAYDRGSDLPDEDDQFNKMPDLEVANAQSQQLFVVRATVPYNNVAYIPLPFTNSMRLAGQSIMRHE